jgi:hypothetical protein
VARGCQIGIFGGWLAAVLASGAWLGGGGTEGFGYTVENLGLVAVALLPSLILSAYYLIPILLLIALIRRFWKKFPEGVGVAMVALMTPPLALIGLGSGDVVEVPIDVHPLAYWSLVSGWAVVGLGSLRVAAEVMGWFAPPRPVAAPSPPPAPARPRRWDVPGPSEAFWSPNPVAGWRGWDWDGTTLRGMWQEWPTSRLSAGCTFGCERPPGWDCTCGVYATIHRSRVCSFKVVGRVELTGRVIEHEHGYRAEHARIRTLHVPRHLVAPIAAAYPDVEVTPQ